MAPGPQTALIGGRNMPVFLAFKIVNKRSKLENVLYRCVGAPGNKIVNKCTGGIKNSTVVKAAYNYFVLRYLIVYLIFGEGYTGELFINK